MNAQDRILSLEKAAQLIYRTATPTADQVEKIRSKLERGSLARGPRGGETTTASAVADYLATASTNVSAARHQHARSLSSQEPVPGLYQGLLKDYFLAVLLQRTERRRTKAFNVAVLACQAFIALLPLVILVSTYRSSMLALIKSPERQAVEAWLEENFDDYRIDEMQVTNNTVHLKFWYRHQGQKGVQSARVLTLDEGAVETATMPD